MKGWASAGSEVYRAVQGLFKHGPEAGTPQCLFLCHVRANSGQFIHVGLPDGAGHRACLLGIKPQMHMVVHQHVGMNEDLMIRARLARRR